MNFLIALACHFIGDFPLQSEWIAINKGKSWEVNFYHAVIYTAIFVLMGATPIQATVLCVSHFCIDPLKARWGIIKSIWQDQILHLIILCILFL